MFESLPDAQEALPADLEAPEGHHLIGALADIAGGAVLLDHQPAVPRRGQIHGGAAVQPQLVPKVLRDGQGALFPHALRCVSHWLNLLLFL